MGNTPSKEPQGRLPQNKLSKPRAVSFTTTASVLPPSPSNGNTASSIRPPDKPHHLISIPYSEIVNSESPDDNDDQDAHGDSDRPSFLFPPKVQRRLSLFRSKSSQETTDRRKSRRNTVIGSPSLTPGDGAIVRANSVSTHHPVDKTPTGLGLSTTEQLPVAGSRASWAYDLSSYEAQRILNLVRDQPTPLPRSQTSTSLVEREQEEVRRRASRRVSLPIQPTSPPISRSNSEMSLHPPMRRRSMIQTPGVATRTRPSPSSAKSVKSSFRHSHPPTPSMSRQPSLESNDGRFLSLPPLPSSANDAGPLYRVVTPKDTDYSTTGAFKLGTLRITNGSPELTPDVAAALEAVDEQCASDDNQGDYFSQEPSFDRAVADFTSISQFSSGTGECQKPSVSVARLGQHMLESNTPNLSIVVPSSDLNARYTPDLQLSPASISQDSPSSPTLNTQSRKAAVDDHLFDDDNPLETLAVEVLDVRIDLNAKSFPQHALETIQVESKGVQRTDSGFVSNSKSDSSQSHSSLAKADSGYSSNVSLRSLRGGRKPIVPGKEPRNSLDADEVSPKVQEQCSANSGNELVVEKEALEKAPTPPPKDDAVAMKLAPTLPASDAADDDGAVTLTIPTRIRRKSVREQSAKSDATQAEDRSKNLTETTTPSRNSFEASSSSLSIGNTSQKPGRLHRFLSLRSSTFSKQTLTAHATHAVDNNRVPSIPKDVEEKLREHTGLFPMTTKRLALKNQMSKETLKTILSVGSLELSRDDEMLSSTPSSSEQEEPSAILSDDSEGKESSLKNTFSSMQSNFRHAAISVISNRKSITRKPVPCRDGSEIMTPEALGKDDTMLATEAELTSYQSINSTLGNNAYDLAARALAPVQNQTISMDQARFPMRSVSSGNAALQKRKSSPPVSMTTRGSFRSPPPRSPLNPQGPAVLQTKNRGENSSASTPNHGTAYSPAEGLRRGRSASGFQYRAASCGPTTRRMSLSTYGTSPSSSRHNSISSVQSENPAGLDLKRQTSLDGFKGTPLNVYMAQPAHQGPSGRPGWNPQNSSHVGGQHLDQHVWLPPYVPRDSHRRNLSASSRPYDQGVGQAPYRILHSYNSPAYRNAPIWG